MTVLYNCEILASPYAVRITWLSVRIPSLALSSCVVFWEHLFYRSFRLFPILYIYCADWQEFFHWGVFFLFFGYLHLFVYSFYSSLKLGLVFVRFFFPLVALSTWFAMCAKCRTFAPVIEPMLYAVVLACLLLVSRDNIHIAACCVWKLKAKWGHLFCSVNWRGFLPMRGILFFLLMSWSTIPSFFVSAFLHNIPLSQQIVVNCFLWALFQALEFIPMNSVVWSGL